MIITGKQNLKYFGELTVLHFFMHIKLRRETKEDYMKVGESKAGIELQDN